LPGADQQQQQQQQHIMACAVEKEEACPVAELESGTKPWLEKTDEVMALF